MGARTLYRLRMVMVLAVSLTSACAKMPQTAAVPWDALTDSGDMAGASQETGTFTGTLVLLPCTLTKRQAQLECDASGRRPGMLVSNDTTVHPLLVSNAAMRQKLEALAQSGQRVRVDGILYPSLKAIFVNDVTPIR
jgi:hypothetical protein